MKKKSTKKRRFVGIQPMQSPKSSKETRSDDEVELGHRLFAIRKEYGDFRAFMRTRKTDVPASDIEETKQQSIGLVRHVALGSR